MSLCRDMTCLRMREIMLLCICMPNINRYIGHPGKHGACSAYGIARANRRSETIEIPCFSFASFQPGTCGKCAHVCLLLTHGPHQSYHVALVLLPKPAKVMQIPLVGLLCACKSAASSNGIGDQRALRSETASVQVPGQAALATLRAQVPKANLMHPV